LFELRSTRLDDQTVRLHFSFDLLIGDAWSMVILGRELAQLYQNPDASLPHLEIFFRDYVLAELNLRDTEIYKRALNYWSERLLDLPSRPELPIIETPDSLIHPKFA